MRSSILSPLVFAERDNHVNKFALLIVWPCTGISARIVLVEGNYVLLDSQPWDELKRLFGDTW